MTYCLGILSKEGIVGLADTRITSGSDTTSAKKIYTVQREKHTYFIIALITYSLTVEPTVSL